MSGSDKSNNSLPYVSNTQATLIGNFYKKGNLLSKARLHGSHETLLKK